MDIGQMILSGICPNCRTKTLQLIGSTLTCSQCGFISNQTSQDFWKDRGPMEAKKNNPWAICTASVGRDDKAKYERCVKKVKKKTGYREDVELDPVEQIAEMITDDPDIILDLTEAETKPEDKPEEEKADDKEESSDKPKQVDPHVRAARMRHGMATREDIAAEFVISEDMSAIGMMPTREKSVEELEADMDAILASLGPEAPVKPEVEPEIEPGMPDAPEPVEPDPFNPTQPAVDPHPKACDYM